MAYTQEQLDTLKDAIAQGAREVCYGDKRVAYQSLNDMLRIQKNMEDELGISSRPKPYHPIFQKGL